MRQPKLPASHQSKCEGILRRNKDVFTFWRLEVQQGSAQLQAVGKGGRPAHCFPISEDPNVVISILTLWAFPGILKCCPIQGTLGEVCKLWYVDGRCVRISDDRWRKFPNSAAQVGRWLNTTGRQFAKLSTATPLFAAPQTVNNLWRKLCGMFPQVIKSCRGNHREPPEVSTWHIKKNSPKCTSHDQEETTVNCWISTWILTDNWIINRECLHFLKNCCNKYGVNSRKAF